MRIRHGFCLINFIVAVWFCLSVNAADESPRVDEGSLLWISDVHFNPFHGGDVLPLATADGKNWRNHQKWGKILASMPVNQKCSGAEDTNDFLMQMVLQKASEVTRNSKPDFILMTGDFLSHDFTACYFNRSGLPQQLLSVDQHNDFVRQTMAYVAMSVSDRFPGIPVIAVLGNNDAFCGDYDVRGNSGFLASTQATFQKYFLADLSDDFQELGGCYSTEIPQTNHRVIVLNSIPFMQVYPALKYVSASPLQKSSCESLRRVELVDEDQWLRNEVNTLNSGNKAWIACHVPPGINCYDGRQYWNSQREEMGKQSFIDQFVSFYRSKQQHLAGILAGHSHMAEFKLINGQQGEPQSSVLMAPSVARNHGNNASFRLMKFDRKTLFVNDYVTHWIDASSSPPKWAAPFSFTETYQQPDVSPSSLNAVYQRMNSGDRGTIDQYFSDYSTRNGAGNSSARRNFRLALPSLLAP